MRCEARLALGQLPWPDTEAKRGMADPGQIGAPKPWRKDPGDRQRWTGSSSKGLPLVLYAFGPAVQVSFLLKDGRKRGLQAGLTPSWARTLGPAPGCPRLLPKKTEVRSPRPRPS
jgi:hypothetical protein